MSYSRWGGSTWYTYWSASSGSELKDQIFSVCAIKDFFYYELKENMEKCLDDCEAVGPQRTELKSYMLRFMADAESETYPRDD